MAFVSDVSHLRATAADASPGVLMKGTGNLNFKSLKPYESGFFIPYNVKDIQALETEGGLVILVSVNNEAMRMFEGKTDSGRRIIAAK